MESTRVKANSPTESVVQHILEIGVMPVVRLDTLQGAVALTEALIAGGVPVIEFTLTTPRALDAVRACRSEVPEAVVGAGTVLDEIAAHAAIMAGAQFLVTPTVRPDVIALGRRYGVPTFCGALTPTEILTAWEAGSPCIKVFPASLVGPSYFKAVREPLPQLQLMPSGGVSAENTGDFIRAGAAAVSAGGQLIDSSAVAQGDWGVITIRARAFVDAVQEARRR